MFVLPSTLPGMRRLGTFAGCLLLLVLEGCLSFTTPEYVLKHRDKIQTDLKVEVDISDASSFTGDVDSVLKDIEKRLAPLPERYREKMGKIKIVDGFFGEYTLMAPFVGAYTDKDGTVFLRNADVTRFLQRVFLFPRNDTLVHEMMHSVHFREIKHWTDTGRPTPEFEYFVKAWECQYFGDVNADGELDDGDIAYVNSHAERFDANRDGLVDSADVEAISGAPYVQGRWASLRGLHVLLWMSFQQITPRPTGFASAYAKTYVWEDAAETMRYLWRLGLAPALYLRGVDREAADRAWKILDDLKRKDPLLARKVFIIVNYIAAHEEPARLSAAWTNYLNKYGGVEKVIAKATTE